MSRASSQMVEECILPDDDDVMLESNNETRCYKKPNSQPFIITCVSSKRSATRTSQGSATTELISPDLPSPITPFQPQGYLTISEGKLIMPYQNTPAKANYVTPVQSNTKSSVNDDTICLDSDEEDTVNSNVTAVASTSQVTAPTHGVSTGLVNQSQMPLLSTVQGIPLMVRLNETQTITGDTPETQHYHPAKSQPNNVIATSVQDKLVQRKNGTVSVNPNQQASSLTATVKQPDPQQITLKKVCKPGDIVRITEKGDLEVLTRVEKLPINIKPKLLNSDVRPLPDAAVIKHKAKQTITEKLKLPVYNLSTKTVTVNDPLSILKDVVHIQAGEYEKPANKTYSKLEDNKVDRNKSTAPIPLKTEIKKAFKDLVKIKSGEKIPHLKESSEKSNYSSLLTKIKPVSFSSQQTSNSTKKTVPQVTQKPAEKKPKPAESRPTDRQRPKPTSSIVVGSSKDIILRTKSTGGAFLKASTSTNNA